MATSVKLDASLKQRLQQLAGARQRSPHWLMREAIREYVDREEAREDFKQEALASWEIYQETGRHLTGEEVRTWLRGCPESLCLRPSHTRGIFKKIIFGDTFPTFSEKSRNTTNFVNRA